MAGGKAAADPFGGLDRAGIGEGFGDAGLEPFVEQGFLAIERSQARTDHLTDRGGAARFDAILRRGGERAERAARPDQERRKIALSKTIQIGYKWRRFIPGDSGDG